MYQLFHVLVERKLRYHDEFVRGLSSLPSPIVDFKRLGIYLLL